MNIYFTVFTININNPPTRNSVTTRRRFEIRFCHEMIAPYSKYKGDLTEIHHDDVRYSKDRTN